MGLILFSIYPKEKAYSWEEEDVKVKGGTRSN